MDSPEPASVPAPPSLRWSGLTDRGKVRPNNEDAFLALSFDGHEVRYLGKTGTASLAGTDFVFAVSDGISWEYRSQSILCRCTMVDTKYCHLPPSG